MLLSVSALALLGMLSSQALAGGLGAAAPVQTTSPGETTLPEPDPAPPPAPKPAPKPRSSTPPKRAASAPWTQSTPPPPVRYSTPTVSSDSGPRRSSPARHATPLHRNPSHSARQKRHATPTPLPTIIALHRLGESQSERGVVLGVTVALRSPLSLVGGESSNNSNRGAWMALLSMPLGIGLLLLLGAMTPTPILHRSAHLRGLMTRRTDLAAYGIGITVTILVAYLIAGLGH